MFFSPGRGENTLQQSLLHGKLTWLGSFAHLHFFNLSLFTYNFYHWPHLSRESFVIWGTEPSTEDTIIILKLSSPRAFCTLQFSPFEPFACYYGHTSYAFNKKDKHQNIKGHVQGIIRYFLSKNHLNVVKLKPYFLSPLPAV